MAYMFRYDTVHGKYKGDVAGHDGGFYIDGKKIANFAARYVGRAEEKDLATALVRTCLPSPFPFSDAPSHFRCCDAATPPRSTGLQLVPPTSSSPTACCLLGV